MANMSYCRFRNTYSDLVDCMSNFRDDLTGEEFQARKAMIKLCREIVEIHGEVEDEEECRESDVVCDEE